MFNFHEKKGNMSKELEIRAMIMEEIYIENKQIRDKENLILEHVKQSKTYFENHYAGTYLAKLQSLSDTQLKAFTVKGCQQAILYIRQLGAEILKEDIVLPQRVLGIMLHDLTDSVHNISLALEEDTLNRTALEFELLLLLQFVHAYDDYQNIQKDLLCVPFISFKNSFPKDFLMEIPNTTSN